MQTLRKWALWTTVVLSLLGGVLAFYATRLSVRVTQEGLTGPSGCTINDWISCDAVHTSSYAILLGIPVAWWGLLFYSWIMIASFFAALTRNKGRATATISFSIILSFFSAAFSIYKAYHLKVIGVLCPICVGMYITNFAIFFLLLQANNLSLKRAVNYFIHYFKASFGRDSELKFSPQPILYLALITSVFSLGYIGFKSYSERSQRSSGLNQVVEAHFRQKPVIFDIEPTTAVWGNPDAELAIIEFSDFECPGCRVSALHLRNLLFEYRNKVRLYFVNYPLDKSINKYVTRNVHPQAGLAARAGVCAQGFGDFWGYHDEIFIEQKKISRPKLLHLAEKRGWDRAEFELCMDRESTISRVQRDISHAKNIGVKSTPTLFINGRLVKYWNSPDVIREILKRELR